jgi:DNA-binding transcriptional LysR family regulator
MAVAPRPKSHSSKGDEEGPSIYKLHQLLRMLEAAIENRANINSETDIAKFFGRYLPSKAGADAKRRPTQEDDEDPSSGRFRAYCIQLAKTLKVSYKFVFDRITRGLLHDEAQLKELCDQLRTALENIQGVVSFIRDEPINRPLTIRIGTTNLINMRLLPTVLESVRQKFKDVCPGVQLRFVQKIMDSDELLFGVQPVTGLDVIVACCLDAQAGKLPKNDVVATLPLRCCLLRKRDTESRDPVGRQCLTNWDMLRGTSMIALTSRRKHFDVPWMEIEDAVESINEVPTLLEAHARVAASDSCTLSYRELMDDVDERTLESLDLPPDIHREQPLVVAVLPHHRPPRKTSAGTKAHGDVSREKQKALALLKTCLQVAFAQKQSVRREAEELTKYLSRFPYSYHVSDYAGPGATKSRRMWFAGRASLECTSNGNLTGVLSFVPSNGDTFHLRVFGRPIRYHDGNVWHFQWRSADPRAESGTTSLVVSKADLKEGQVLVGCWVGRSSWIGEEVRPSGGPFILHTRPDMTPTNLELIMRTAQERCVPDLRSLSSEMRRIAIPLLSEPPKKSSTPPKIARTRKPRRAVPKKLKKPR